MYIIGQSEIKKIFPLSRIGTLLKTIENAFGDYALDKVQMPPKQYLYFKKHDGDLRIMPAYSCALEMAGTKIVNVHPKNPQKGLKTVMAVIVINDAKTGIPLALMDGTYITGIRTGAAGALAAKYLAKKGATTMGVVGAGEQALYQIMATIKIRRFKKIIVFDISESAVGRLKKILAKEGIKISKGTIKEASGQDVLITTTPSRTPIIKEEWIMPGTHINAIGADAQGKEELDPKILKRAKIVVDDWTQASHSGEINVPFSRGIIQKKDIYGLLGEIVAQKKPGRQNDKEITVFDSTGLAIQDLYTANFFYYLFQKKNKIKNFKIF